MPTRLVVLALALSAGMPAVAETPGACAAAGGPADQVVIDARDGTVTAKKQRYGKRDSVRVCLTNMNPFVFEYTLEGAVHAVEEPALADIRSLLTPAAPTSPKAAASPSPTADATKALAFQRATPVPDPCAAPLAALHGQTQALNALVSEAQEQVARTSTSLAPLDAAWQAAHRALFEGGAKTGAELRSAATTARDALAAPTATPVTEHQLEAIAESAVVLRDDLRELIDERTCASRNSGFIEEARRQVEETLGGFLPAAREARRVQHETLTRVQELRDALGRVLARPDAFETQRTFGPYSQPTDVTVHARRKPLRGSATTDLAEVNLNFGGQARFAYSAGPVMAFLDNHTFGRVEGLSDGAKQARVGYKQRDNRRARLLALGHVRLFDLGDDKASVFATLGRVLDSENELLFGASLGVAENRFLFTLGAYRGLRDVLEGGLKPEDVLPADFEAEIPVRKQFNWKFAAGVSMRLK